MKITSTHTLQNGVAVPVIGFGTCTVDRKPYAGYTAVAVKNALKAGVRLIDTATCYENEGEAGEGIRNSGLAREEVFVLTKMWNDNMRQGTQREALDYSLNELKMSHVDAYLLHWPVPGKFRICVQ